MLAINTNVTALNAQLSLNQHTQEINRLTKALIDANGDGSTSVGLDGAAASVVPNYLTSFIRGTTQAMANTDRANDLMLKEKNTLTSMIDALKKMQAAAVTIKTPDGATAESVAAAPSQFNSARDSLLTAIASNVYNGKSLSDGGALQFQVGPNPKDKIAVDLTSLTSGTAKSALAAVQTLTTTDVQTNTDYTIKIQAALDQINQADGGVTANISRLGFAKSRLETDSARSVDYRSKILGDAVSTINAKLAVQRMLQSVAEAVLAQANVSSQGVLALIASAKLN
jgi:flagellin